MSSLLDAGVKDNVIPKVSGTIVVYGVCWNTAITPTIADNKTTVGAGVI